MSKILCRKIVSRGLIASLVGAVPVLGTAPVVAQWFDEAIIYYQKGEYAAAFADMKPLAERGDMLAQYYLALMYENGQGIAPDPAAAIDWFRRAADGGLHDAQKALADRYILGKAVAQDDIAAAHLYRLAAEAGNPQAQAMLGQLYRLGRGVPEDRAEAERWRQMAAEQGVANGGVTIGPK